jgi:hypothetical protein
MARAKRSGGDGGVSTRRGASGGGGPWLLLLAGLGCGCAVDLGVDGVGAAGAVDDGALPATAAAPLVGVSGAGDFADRACQVFLVDAGRVQQGAGFAVDAASGGWIFDARVEVTQAALAEGFTPMLLARPAAGAAWQAVAPAGSTAMPDARERFLFTLQGEAWPGPGDDDAQVALVPYLVRGDARLFDHNRLDDDLAAYVLDAAGGFVVGADDDVCAPPAGPTLRFAADGAISSTGPLVVGRPLTIDYALERLPECRSGYAGRPAWNIQAHALFRPGGEHLEASVLDTATSTGSTWFRRPAVFAVPAGATAVELWFHNTDRSGCSRYDSDFGQNHRFVVLPADDVRAPDWLGDVTATVSRASSRRCGEPRPWRDDLAYGTWARQRAAITDLCFDVWEPGVTDFDNPALWQQLDARVELRFAGATTASTSYATFVERVGNNARYAVDLRAFDPFLWGRCVDGIPLERGIENNQPMVQATAELRVVVNGRPLAHDDRDVFRVVYRDHADAPRVACP